jgi:uncharacterized protein
MSETLSLLRAARKPVIGMVQLPPLAGGSGYCGGSIDDVLDVALSEASALSDNGVEVLMIQNLGDIPVSVHAAPVQVAWMTRVTAEVRQKFGRPVGLNLLENDAEAMFAIASAAHADFVRIKIYVGAMMTPFGIETAQAHAAIKARNSWRAENIAIFADVHDRTGTPIASGGFEEDVEFALRLGRADALVLTGKSYAETLHMVTTVRAQYAEAPIVVGGGVTAENFGELARVADGAIVSTSMKGTGSAVGRIVPEKVKAFMTAARNARATAA